jgi:hypothetical protein
MRAGGANSRQVPAAATPFDTTQGNTETSGGCRSGSRASTQDGLCPVDGGGHLSPFAGFYGKKDAAPLLIVSSIVRIRLKLQAFVDNDRLRWSAGIARFIIPQALPLHPPRVCREMRSTFNRGA